MTIPTDILGRRLALKLSQGDLAKLVGNGVRQQDINRLEKGQTKTSKYKDALLAALDAEEARRASPAPAEPEPPATNGIPPDRVLAALEVVMHILCKSDIAARGAAGALLSVLQARQSPPLGVDRLSVIRIETQRIVERLSDQVH